MAKATENAKIHIELPVNPVFILSAYGLDAATEDGFILLEADAVKVVTSSSYWSNGNEIIDDIWAIPLNELVPFSSAIKVYGKRPIPGNSFYIWSRLDKPITAAFIEAHELKKKFEGARRPSGKAKIVKPTTLYLAKGSLSGKHWWSTKSRVMGLFTSEEEAIRLTPAHFELEVAVADGLSSYNRKTIRGKFGAGFGYAEGYGKSDPNYEAYEEAKHLHSH